IFELKREGREKGKSKRNHEWTRINTNNYSFVIAKKGKKGNGRQETGDGRKRKAKDGTAKRF
ncbi:MAG: hypothetical protein M0O96_12155, partial [Desulforhopalus sp.]|nr:hypothetical protein [Desulforhopalus sp.]